jgi:hypothetical protein
MGGKHHTPEEIAGELRQVEVLTAQGRPVAEAVRAIGVTEPTCYRRRAECGGLKPDQMKRLKWSAAAGEQLKPACPVIVRFVVKGSGAY